MRRVVVESALALARSGWRALPSPVRGAFGLAVGARLRDGLAGRVRAGPWEPESASPVVVSAFYEGASGVAAAGRASADGLERAGYAVIRHDLGALLDAGGFQAHDLPGQIDGVWLLHANPPEAKLAFARLRAASWERRFRIGYWAWELPRAPADWHATARAFHTIWAPSPFVFEALAGIETPRVMRPHPPPPIAGVRPGRAAFGLPESGALVLALADLKSGFRRKNPLGAVEAFRLAFPEPGEVVLVVKLHSAGADPAALAALHAATVDRADIRLIDARLPHVEVLSLIASADVLLSLHRAEGFGYPLAEALALGRAVLATGWSGSEAVIGDILDARVAFTLTPVVDPDGPYDDPSQLWAEPDLQDAAVRIRRLAADPAARAMIAAEGAAALQRLQDAWSLDALLAEPWSRGASRLNAPAPDPS